MEHAEEPQTAPAAANQRKDTRRARHAAGLTAEHVAVVTQLLRTVLTGVIALIVTALCAAVVVAFLLSAFMGNASGAFQTVQTLLPAVVSVLGSVLLLLWGRRPPPAA